MRLIKNTSNDTFFNMAVEEYFLTTASEPLVILWRNARTVVIGRNQNALEEIDTDFVRRYNIDVVRRLTGGGAVFHDLGNINFTVIQKHTPGLFQNYEYFTSPICQYLQSLGVNAVFSGRNDLLIDGKKFSGNAQVVKQDNIMHHGTIMFSANVTDLVGALRPNKLKISSKSVKSVQARVTNIAEHLSDKLSSDEFYTQLLTVFTQQGYVLTEITASEAKSIEQLAAEKYRSWEWNFGKAPNYTMAQERLFPFGIVALRLHIVHGYIEQFKIYGDFFGVKDIAELEQQLCGQQYQRESLSLALDNIAIDEYISGMTQEQLLSLLLEEKTNER